MVIDIGRYRIQPYGNNLCWELYEFVPEHVADRGKAVGETIPDRYVSMNVYPSTLEHAVDMVCERLAKDDPTIGDARACSDALARMCATLKAAITEGNHA